MVVDVREGPPNSLGIEHREEALELSEILILNFDGILVGMAFFFLVLGCFEAEHFAENFGVPVEEEPVDFE